MQARDGNILVGTDGGGLNLFDPPGNKFTHYKHNPLQTKSIGSNKIKAFLEDLHGRIWIGFWGSGFDHFDVDRGKFTHFRKDKASEKTTLSNDNVTCMAEDQQGYIWLGTFGGGLNKFDPARKTFQHYVPDITKPNSLSDKNIWEVLVDTQNNLWVGTSNGRLNLFDRKNEQFITIPLYTSEESSYAVQVLFEDSKQRLWVGLAGGGLKLLNKKNKTFTSFNQQNGLSATSINSIEEAPNGDLWLSTNLGILQFNPQTRRSHIFGLGEGVQGLHFNRQASLVLSSGEMLFGGNNGFNLFHPDSLVGMNANFPVVFTDFQIFNQPVAIGKEGSPLKDQINQTQTINLSDKESVFSIEYAALSYTAPEKIAYQYRLKGFVDENWQKVGTTRKVTYTNLAPKQYLFEVRATMDDNLSPVRALTIRVIPPWWQTWLFKILSACSALAFIFVWYKAKTYRIRKRNKDLEARVLERTNQIETQKQEIEAQRDNLNSLNLAISEKNEELEKKVVQRTQELQANNEALIKSNYQIKQSLQEKDVLLSEVHHRVKNNLAVISGLLQMQVFNTDNKQVHAILQDSQNRIKSMALIHEKLYQNGTFANIEFSTYIHDLIKEIKFSYPEKAEAVEVNVYLDKIFLELNTAIPCGLLFNELLSNVYKHAFKGRNSGRIDIAFSQKGEYYILKVSDNGIGLNPSADIQKFPSLGMKLIQTLVKQLQGEVEFINNNGLTFILKFIPFKMKVWK